MTSENSLSLFLKAKSLARALNYIRMMNRSKEKFTTSNP